MSNIVIRANELNSGIVYKHEDHKGLFNKIDGFIRANKSTKDWLKQRWQDKLNDSNLNTDIIDKLYIESKDGWFDPLF